MESPLVEQTIMGRFFLPCVVALLCAGTAPAAVSFCEPRPVPGVRSLSCKTDVEVRLDAAQTVTVTCPDAAAAD